MLICMLRLFSLNWLSAFSDFICLALPLKRAVMVEPDKPKAYTQSNCLHVLMPCHISFTTLAFLQKNRTLQMQYTCLVYQLTKEPEHCESRVGQYRTSKCTRGPDVSSVHYWPGTHHKLNHMYVYIVYTWTL